MLEGCKAREEKQIKQTVQQTAWILQGLGQKVTADDLLRKPIAPEEIQASKVAYEKAPQRLSL